MKALRYHGRRDLRVDDVPEPTLSAADEVLLEVALCGICGTDLHEYTDGPIVIPTRPHPLTGASAPQILGHEFSGVVRAIGAEVRDVAVGQRVAVMPAIICGRCYFCRRGDGHLCRDFAATGLSAASGGLSRFAVVREYQVTVLPDEVTDAEGALIEPAAVAAYGVDRAGVTGGETVLVTGTGPIGLLSALYAQASGAALVIMTEPNANRAERARAIISATVLDPTADGFEDAILELTESAVGVDLTVECSGTSAGLGSALRLTRNNGSIVQTGLHTRPATFDAMALSEKNLALYGSWCFRVTDWPRIVQLVASGRYPVANIVTATLPLDELVPRGFDVLVNPAGDQLKVLGSPQQESNASSPAFDDAAQSSVTASNGEA